MSKQYVNFIKESKKTYYNTVQVKGYNLLFHALYTMNIDKIKEISQLLPKNVVQSTKVFDFLTEEHIKAGIDTILHDCNRGYVGGYGMGNYHGNSNNNAVNYITKKYVELLIKTNSDKLNDPKGARDYKYDNYNISLTTLVKIFNTDNIAVTNDVACEYQSSFFSDDDYFTEKKFLDDYSKDQDPNKNILYEIVEMPEYLEKYYTDELARKKIKGDGYNNGNFFENYISNIGSKYYFNIDSIIFCLNKLVPINNYSGLVEVLINNSTDSIYGKVMECLSIMCVSYPDAFNSTNVIKILQKNNKISYSFVNLCKKHKIKIDNHDNVCDYVITKNINYILFKMLVDDYDFDKICYDRGNLNTLKNYLLQIKNANYEKYLEEKKHDMILKLNESGINPDCLKLLLD